MGLVLALGTEDKGTQRSLRPATVSSADRMTLAYGPQAAAMLASATARRLTDETSKSSALMASRKRADDLSSRCAVLETQVKELKRSETRSRERYTEMLGNLKVPRGRARWPFLSYTKPVP